ncbi:hypothetical protein VNO78_28571 [Psophocarpus tetragonolobus]|uniref:Uncharacterized protein n=1 Tax=Psophocarpus tetragonolobus TaxID=3891 RepID=A0AAN9RTF1_PSOTE
MNAPFMVLSQPSLGFESNKLQIRSPTSTNFRHQELKIVDLNPFPQEPPTYVIPPIDPPMKPQKQSLN